MLVELLEYAIERVEDAMQSIDDSNGEAGSIEDALGDMHLNACELAQPESCALAERLFRMEMRPCLWGFVVSARRHTAMFGANKAATVS